jgi:dCMP deaminase
LKNPNYRHVRQFAKFIRSIGYVCPRDLVAMIQAMIVAARSPCKRDKRGIVVYAKVKNKVRVVCAGYKGPARGDDRCRGGKCHVSKGKDCPGILAESMITTNNPHDGLIADGTVYATHYPSRKGFKPSWQADVGMIAYYSDEGAQEEDRLYVARHPGTEVIRFDALMRRKYPDEADDLLTLAEKAAAIIAKMRKPIAFEDAGILLALANSARVHCIKQKAGCVGFDHLQRWVTAGYNGPLTRDKHCDEEGCVKDKGGKCIGGHGETNMVNNLTCPDDLQGGTVYITLTPCKDCGPLLVHLHPSRIICYDHYVREPSIDDPTTCEWNTVREVAEQAGVEIWLYTQQGLERLTDTVRPVRY